MAENSLIGWTHHTENFWMGCDKVAPECAKCYIGRVLARQGRKPWGNLYRTKTWKEPARWQKWAEQNDVYLRVFTCSLSDFFHQGADPWREEAWAIIRDTPNLIWLVLTKRPELIERRLPADWGSGYRNVWLGVSSGCRRTLNKMDTLRRIPAALRFLSAEPLLEDITVCQNCQSPRYWPARAAANNILWHDTKDGESPMVRCERINLDGFGWLITGGESNPVGHEYKWNPTADWRKEFETPGRRTMKKEWALALQTLAAQWGLPFYFKQATAPQPGQGENFLGEIAQAFPPAPGEWALKEAA